MRPFRWTALAATLALAALGGCTNDGGDGHAADDPSSREPVDLSAVENYYGEYEDFATLMMAIQNGEVTPDELEHHWVVEQNHVDIAAGWDGTPPEYELSPAAGGDHLSAWQTCTGSVYDAPIVEGNAVHSMEHGAVWLTYDPELVDQATIDALGLIIKGRDYSLMSPYPGQGVAVSLQSWGNRYQTDDPADPVIEGYLDGFILNDRFNPESNAPCSGGISVDANDL